MCSGNKEQALDWSSEQDEILIDFVKSHECLFNVQLKDYRKTQLKKSLWHQIGRILNKTDIDSSKRWAYIRDYYIRRRGKPGTGSSGEAAKKRSEQLSFLDTLPSSKRSTITNIDDTVSAKKRTDDVTRKEDSTEKDLIEQMQREEVSEEGERTKLLRQIAERQQQPQVQDETDLFFASMAKIVKKLPERDRAEIRLQIGTLVGNAEIAYLSRSRSDHDRPPSTSDATSDTISDATFEDFLSENVLSPPAPSATRVLSISDLSNSSNLTMY